MEKGTDVDGVVQELDNDGSDINPNVGPPRFIGEAENFNRFVARTIGQTVRLRCPAEGHPRPTIVWTLDDQPINRTGPTRTRAWAIIMDYLSTTDAGRYKCSVCNRFGCIEYTIKLQVNGDGKIQQTVITCTILCDNKLFVIPEAESQPDNVEILSQIADDIASTASYVDTANSKRETARFAQELGSVDDDNNFEAPTFINVSKFPTTISRHSGETIQLKCPAEGIPQPNITWTKDGNILSDETNLKDRTWSIAVQSLVTNDAGQYTCQVCNEYGCIEFTTKVEVVGKSGRTLLKCEVY